MSIAHLYNTLYNIKDYDNAQHNSVVFLMGNNAHENADAVEQAKEHIRYLTLSARAARVGNDVTQPMYKHVVFIGDEEQCLALSKQSEQVALLDKRLNSNYSEALHQFGAQVLSSDFNMAASTSWRALNCWATLMLRVRQKWNELAPLVIANSSYIMHSFINFKQDKDIEMGLKPNEAFPFPLTNFLATPFENIVRDEQCKPQYCDNTDNIKVFLMQKQANLFNKNIGGMPLNNVFAHKEHIVKNRDLIAFLQTLSNADWQKDFTETYDGTTADDVKDFWEFCQQINQTDKPLYSHGDIDYSEVVFSLPVSKAPNHSHMDWLSFAKYSFMMLYKLAHSNIINPTELFVGTTHINEIGAHALLKPACVKGAVIANLSQKHDAHQYLITNPLYLTFACHAKWIFVGATHIDEPFGKTFSSSILGTMSNLEHQENTLTADDDIVLQLDHLWEWFYYRRMYDDANFIRHRELFMRSPIMQWCQKLLNGYQEFAEQGVVPKDEPNTHRMYIQTLYSVVKNKNVSVSQEQRNKVLDFMIELFQDAYYNEVGCELNEDVAKEYILANQDEKRSITFMYENNFVHPYLGAYWREDDVYQHLFLQYNDLFILHTKGVQFPHDKQGFENPLILMKKLNQFQNLISDIAALDNNECLIIEAPHSCTH